MRLPRGVFVSADDWPVIGLDVSPDSLEIREAASLEAGTILHNTSRNVIGIERWTTRPHYPLVCGNAAWIGGIDIVDGVDEVIVDGAVLDPSAWFYNEHNQVLYRNDGVWPKQRMDRPTTSEGTWEVKYRKGLALTAADIAAHSELAVELANKRAGRTCRLPAAPGTVNREGITVYIDPKFFNNMPMLSRWRDEALAGHNRRVQSVVTPESIAAHLVRSSCGC